MSPLLSTDPHPVSLPVKDNLTCAVEAAGLVISVPG